jgi:hypothetical protein
VTVAAPLNGTLPERPYPGLRAFNPDEWAIFFGRERMIEEVIGRLTNSRLVLIHGASGSGKSSLVRAGVLPKLALQYRRHDAPWLTCNMRPSGGPLWNLAAAFAGLEGRDKDVERIADIASSFSGRSATLASVAASIDAVKGKSLCVLVDQFEELFRYERESSSDEAELFIDLIRRAASEDAQIELAGGDLHVIVTMRSEFLGECARFAGFAETINRTQYLVPRLDEDGLMRAVRRPAQMYGAIFEESLSERLIASVRGREDELPLLQHGLTLIWENGKERARPGEKVKLDGAIVDDAKGLIELLSRHADNVMASVAPEARRALVEVVFRALTGVNSESAAIRRPLAFRKLCAETGAAAHDLLSILDAFRGSGVSFLSPYASERIEDKTPIDISHEALIRCWRKIGEKPDGWLQREIRDGLAWRALLDQAEAFANDRRGFLSEPATEVRGPWLKGRNADWAERYHGGWSKVEALINASEKHWEGERRAREARQREELEKAQAVRAEELYGQLSPVERAAAKRLFVSLVAPGEGGVDARARIATPDDVVMHSVIQRFAGAEPRIIVTDEADGRRYVEISHEALIRQWGRLRVWIDENRWNLRTRNFLMANRTEWLKHDRDPDLLDLPGLRLEEARQLLDEPGDVVIDEVKDYIDAALERQEQRREEEKARQHAELQNARLLVEAERQAKEAAEQKALAEQHARDAAEKAAAEQKAHTEAEHAARLQAQVSAAKLRRALIGVVAAAVVALIAFGVSLYYSRQASEQSKLALADRIRAVEESERADRDLDRANQALAEAINNNLVLNPDES